MKKVRVWTEEKEDYLRDKFFSMSLKSLSKKLGVTETAILVKSNRLGLRRSNLIISENFYTQQDLLKEAKKRKIYLTRDIINSLIESKMIKKHQSRKNSFLYFNQKDYDFVLDFFSKYELVMTLHDRLKKKGVKLTNRKALYNLLVDIQEDPRIEIKKLEGVSVLFINKTSSAFIENLLVNHLTKAQFAEKVYYSISGIHYLIQIGVLTSIKFANKHWIHKNMIEKIKYHYEPRKNQYC